jgi:hypothetical protein
MKRLNNNGFAHFVLLMLFVVVFAIAGVAYLVASHADNSAVAPETTRKGHVSNNTAIGVTLAHDTAHPITFAKGGKRNQGGSTNTSGYGSGPLTYNGGFVLHNPTVRAIYWVPQGFQVSTGYVSTINGFLQNVAASAGTTSNVFATDTQYTDSTGPANPWFKFGGGLVDTQPYPANGCTVTYTTTCISDAQVETELTRFAATQGWPTGGEQVYAVMLAKGVGECTTSTGYCAFVNACAWHHDHGYVLPTAYVPYADSYSGCGTSQHPNGDEADSTINTLSHELNELITDAPQSSWYDTAGYENGDKCAWLFGNVLGGTNGAFYNQVIGSGHYFIQTEWSNKANSCVQTAA